MNYRNYFGSNSNRVKANFRAYHCDNWVYAIFKNHEPDASGSDPELSWFSPALGSSASLVN